MLPIPVIDNLRCRSISWAMLVILALNVLGYIAKMMAIMNGNGEWFMATFSLIPANVTNAFISGDPGAIGMGLLSILTATFMHGSLSHIFGNMLFLFVFGKAVEARLGMWRFVWFYLLCGIGAFGLQMISDPFSQIPNVGASGAIAGVLSAYLVFFPGARIRGLLMPIPIPVTMRAVYFLVTWFVMQLLPVLPLLMAGKMSMSGGGVAYWAHIGGFIVGLVGGYIIKMREPQTEVCYIPTDCKPNDDEAETERE